MQLPEELGVHIIRKPRQPVRADTAKLHRISIAVAELRSDNLQCTVIAAVGSLLRLRHSRLRISLCAIGIRQFLLPAFPLRINDYHGNTVRPFLLILVHGTNRDDSRNGCCQHRNHHHPQHNLNHGMCHSSLPPLLLVRSIKNRSSVAFSLSTKIESR